MFLSSQIFNPYPKTINHVGNDMIITYIDGRTITFKDFSRNL